jgi:hypothetical protein
MLCPHAEIGVIIPSGTCSAMEVPMAVCPSCQSEYGPQMTVCPVCKTDITQVGLDESAASDSADLALTELARFSNVSEAEMIQELIESNGIATVLKGEIDPIGIASKAERTALMVEKKDWARAQEIYQAYFAGEAPEPDQPEQE